MRVNLKKCFVYGLGFTVFWIILSYFWTFDVSRLMRRSNDEDILDKLDRRLNKLQMDMQTQIKQYKTLLDRIKEMAKAESLHGDKVEDEVAPPIIPVLVIACNRVTVDRCLNNLVKYRPNKEMFPIIISQDCDHEKTHRVINKYTSDPSITAVRQPDLSEIALPSNQVRYRGYYKIARHFKFALNYVFMEMNYDAVIIVEDDLDISPDFFEYFQGTYPLLLQDPSLWCVSAWNDNGKRHLIDLHNPQRLYRTDFFPGLGWMLRRDTWLHLGPKWPKAFFDDWLRDPTNVQHRSCIRPEVSRTYSFGKVGVSKGLYFDNHLRHMQLNKQFVEFTKLNLTYLLKPTYDVAFKEAAYSAPIWRPDDVISAAPGSGEPVRVLYSNAQSFRKAASKLGLMDDLRSGIPRTAYLGIVSCYINGRRVYLAPDFDWVSYDPKWS